MEEVARAAHNTRMKNTVWQVGALVRVMRGGGLAASKAEAEVQGTGELEAGVA